jgi:DNA-binding response OmpR family regulator
MKVLVIDDDKFLRSLLESEMRQENLDVFLVENADDAVAKLKAWKPDAIVLDLILPKKDGFELLSELRATAEGKHAPIFIFSSLAQAHDQEEALALGARAYFIKGSHTVHQVVEAITALYGK